MSRTTRKRPQSFYNYYGWQANNTWLTCPWEDAAYIKRQTIRYHNDSSTKYNSNGIPKKYRKAVNRNRRNFDKCELYRAIHFEDYPEQCLDWNGKSNDHYIYY